MTRSGRVTQQRKTGSETSKKRANFAFSLMRTERCAGRLWGGWQIRAFEERLNLQQQQRLSRNLYSLDDEADDDACMRNGVC